MSSFPVRPTNPQGCDRLMSGREDQRESHVRPGRAGDRRQSRHRVGNVPAAAGPGFRVAMTGRDDGAVAKALDSLEHGGNAIAVRMDVTDPDSIRAALETVVSRVGPVDVLVNNAAVLLHEDSDVLETPHDGFSRTFETNVFGVVEVCRVFVPPMARRGYGRVVNVSSGAGQLTGMSTYAPAYAMSKTSLNAFTRILGATYKGRACSQTRSIPAGCGPTWAGRQLRDPWRRAPTASSGSPRFRTTVRPEDFSETGGLFPGDGQLRSRKPTAIGHRSEPRSEGELRGRPIEPPRQPRNARKGRAAAASQTLSGRAWNARLPRECLPGESP